MSIYKVVVVYTAEAESQAEAWHKVNRVSYALDNKYPNVSQPEKEDETQ